MGTLETISLLRGICGGPDTYEVSPLVLPSVNVRHGASGSELHFTEKALVDGNTLAAWVLILDHVLKTCGKEEQKGIALGYFLFKEWSQKV